MLRCLYTAATGMEAQQTRMDVISNNLANASTTGFKKVRAEFEDLLSDTIRGGGAAGPRGGAGPAALQVGLGVRNSATSRMQGQGDLTTTNNPLDLAVQGNGFFRIQQASGDYAYTRAGNFRVDSTGRIVTQGGDVVDPGITVPPDATSITIGADGTVSATLAGKTDASQLGQIQLYTFTNPAGLSAGGGNLLTQTAASGEPVASKPGDQGTGTIAQGVLETSNVKAVDEMIDMIACQRAYELNSKTVTTADQMLQRLTNIR